MARQKCPRCGSRDNATILRGMLAYSADLQRRLDERRVVLGGCEVSAADPRWSCNRCGALFGLPGERAPLFTVVESSDEA